MSPTLPAGLLVILLCLVSAGCRRERVLGPPRAVAVAADGALELSVMSFNIRYETSEDPGSRAWRERVARAVRVIREEAPDVIGLQEALHGQAADLWASLPDFELFGHGRDDGRRAGEYSAILYRRDRFEAAPGDGGTFWLSATPEKPGSMTWGNGIPRIVTWLRLTDRASHRAFYVFNTHWDHRHQGSRERASLLLAKRIDERHHPLEPVVLLGDFNAVEKNPAVAFLRGHQVSLAGQRHAWNNPLVETFDHLHPQATERNTLNFWRGTRSGNLKVDHILASAEARIVSAHIRNHDEPMVSDHFPVLARIVFP